MELTPAARRLRAALDAVLAPGTVPELALVHRWFDGWGGIGASVVGMRRQGYDTGSAPEPWRAAQHAAWDALREVAT